MIRVTVELISARDPSRNRQQAVIEIANIGGDETTAKYRYKIMGKDGRVMDKGVIGDIPRKRFHAVDLVTTALVAARGEKIVRKMK